VHLLVNYPPKVAISALVNSLKGVSSRMLRKKKSYPGIRKKLCGNSLWLPSYFAGSCGGAPISIIRQYIEQQKTPQSNFVILQRSFDFRVTSAVLGSDHEGLYCL